MNEAILKDEIRLLRNNIKILSGKIEDLVVVIGVLDSTIKQKMEKENLEAFRDFEKK